MTDDVKMVFTEPVPCNPKRRRVEECCEAPLHVPREEIKTNERVEVKIEDQWIPADPVETPSMFEAYKDKMRARYQPNFVDETEYALFCMLPIPDKQKDQFIARLRENTVMSKAGVSTV